MTFYPDTFLRGVPNDDFIDRNTGKAKTNVFQFKANDERNDGFLELSINWEDDDHAIIEIHSRKKENGNLQFKNGAVRILLSDLNLLNDFPQVAGAISYERRRLSNNPYHGNLLISENIPKHRIKAISSAIILIASDPIDRNKN